MPIVNPAQNINPYDLILVSDTGKFYVVKMKETNQGHEPDGTIEVLNEVFKAIPDALRSQGVELADIPEHVHTGGCSCMLLNLQRIEGRGPSTEDVQTASKKTSAATVGTKR
jgi:hypothetical protein